MGFKEYLIQKLNEEIEQIEAQEDDCFITSKPMHGYEVSCGGKYIGEFKEIDEALKSIINWQNKNKFYPTIWFVSDHGNMWPIDNNGNEIKG